MKPSFPRGLLSHWESTMKRGANGALLVVAISIGDGGYPAKAQQTRNSWGRCCGMGQWHMDHGMTDHGMMGSMPRHTRP